MILDHIFGSGPGFCDRLGRIVRDELGLVYTIGGGMTDSADVVPGLFRVYASTLFEQTERVINTITEQVQAMHTGAFSDDEVDRARRYLTGAWVFDYQTVEQRRAAARARALGPEPRRTPALARADRRDHISPGSKGCPDPYSARGTLPRRARPATPPRQRPAAECAEQNAQQYASGWRTPCEGEPGYTQS